MINFQKKEQYKFLYPTSENDAGYIEFVILGVTC